MEQAKGARLVMYLIAMSVLGLIGYVFLGWLVEHRIGRPIQVETATQDLHGMTPLIALATGAWLSARTAQESLAAGRRSEAVHALDSAMRALEVAQHAAAEPAGFRKALEAVKRSRHMLQMGRPGQARQVLEGAVAVLAEQTAGQAQGRLPPALALPAYDNAVVLNALGVRVGEVVGVDAQAGVVAISLGGGRDVLGFLDFGGTPVKVPAERLVFGKRQDIGANMVAAPTFAFKVAAIRVDLGDPSVQVAGR